MDSKQVLNKIITMLGMDNKSVELGGNANSGGPFYGKLENGDAVQSDFFDLGHVMFVVKGASLVPAPDADHIVQLPVGLAGGNKRYFITTKDGIITSMNLEDTHGGVKKDVNFSAQTETEMEKTLTTEELGALKDFNEAQAVKKETMAVDPAQRLDALEAEVKQLRDDIAKLFEAQKADDAEDASEGATEMGAETRVVSDAEIKGLQQQDSKQGMPNNGGPSKTNMSSAKKFTGAPVEETVNLSGLFKSKKEGTTLGSVLAKMNNSRF
jgi:hypothetical protein